MKKYALLIISAIFTFSGFAADHGYRIAGRVEGVDSGKVYIIKYIKGSIDTLARGEVKDGCFVLSGRVADRVENAAVAFDGIRGTYLVLLENGVDYTADIDLQRRRNSRIVGGSEQRIWNIILSLDDESKIITRRMEDEVAAARKNNDQAKRDSVGKAWQRHLDDWAGWRIDLAKEHPDSYCAAQILSLQMTGKQLDKLREEYAFLGEYARNTIPGREVAALIAKLEQAETGQVIPDFEFIDTSGKKFSLHDIKGKVILLDFWASWCAPCRKENPNVKAIYADYHSKGLEIIGVTSDEDKKAWIKAIKDDGLPWRHAMSHDVRQYFNISGIPHVVLLDSNYKVITRDLKGEALRSKVAELLGAAK